MSDELRWYEKMVAEDTRGGVHLLLSVKEGFASVSNLSGAFVGPFFLKRKALSEGWDEISSDKAAKLAGCSIDKLCDIPALKREDLETTVLFEEMSDELGMY